MVDDLSDLLAQGPEWVGGRFPNVDDLIEYMASLAVRKQLPVSELPGSTGPDNATLLFPREWRQFIPAVAAVSNISEVGSSIVIANVVPIQPLQLAPFGGAPSLPPASTFQLPDSSDGPTPVSNMDHVPFLDREIVRVIGFRLGDAFRGAVTQSRSLIVSMDDGPESLSNADVILNLQELLAWTGLNPLTVQVIAQDGDWGVIAALLREEFSLTIDSVRVYDILRISLLAHRPPSWLTEPLDHTFLLLGQSNMSGRGRAPSPMEASVTSHDCDFESVAVTTYLHNGSIAWYDPARGWTSGDYHDFVNMHKNVDLLKQTGLGPGSSFAYYMLKALEQSSGLSSARIGLIPAAVGATTLFEWMPDFAARGDQIRKLYHSGCPNLMSCALRSLFLASLTARCPISPSGMLWYQGENDAVLDEEGASSYGARLAQFVSLLRLNISKIVNVLVGVFAGSSRPPGDDVGATLPIVTSVVTGTRPWLLQLASVRSQQSAYLDANMASVDAFGYALQSDCIHLTWQSYVDIGKRMAHKMAAMMMLPCPDSGGWVDKDIHGSRSEACIALMTKALMQHSKIRSEVVKELTENHSWYLNSVTGSAAGGALPILKSRLSPVNFVSGEIEVGSFLNIFDTVGSFPGHTFCDLGCGVGNGLLAALLLSVAEGRRYFSRVWGIDLMSSKVTEAREVIRRTGAELQWDTSLLPTLELTIDNFLQVPWWEECGVCMCTATCFAPDVLEPLFEQARRLSPGAKMVIIDKMLPETDGVYFQLINSLQVHTTWGTANAYTYQRKELDH
jgi:Carbohydrate esterase, sialic acid-specific acetylesterase